MSVRVWPRIGERGSDVAMAVTGIGIGMTMPCDSRNWKWEGGVSVRLEGEVR